jgi:hypothetical protein
MHCQSAHGVKSRNVVVIPDQIIGKFSQHAQTICIVHLNFSSAISCMPWFPLLCSFDTAMLASPGSVLSGNHARY